jgi:thiol-disulfide isomerase/thioredoxin
MRNVLILAVIIAFVVVLWMFRSQRMTVGPAAGVAAPVFEAQALDGTPIVLMKLRGRVVVLDFWATWCGPCRAMIPHERELVKRMADKPFTFIGISADDDVETLKAFVSKLEMTWPQIHDGPGGPLQQSYGIQYYPSIFVLDGNGAIRYRDLRGAELDKAVDVLMKELSN